MTRLFSHIKGEHVDLALKCLPLLFQILIGIVVDTPTFAAVYMSWSTLTVCSLLYIKHCMISCRWLCSNINIYVHAVL